MLNFRKLRQDFASGIVKEGKDLFEKKKVVSAKILHLDNRVVRISGRVQGQYENHYESEIEIDRIDCETVDSDCDCPYNYDCQHLAALIFYLEERLDEIMVNYSKENSLEDLADKHDLNASEKNALIEKFKEAESKQTIKQEELFQKQLLQEYIFSSEMLAVSPFFRPQEKHEIDKAEAAFVFQLPPNLDGRQAVELIIVLRLPSRSKPLHIPYVKKFLEALRYEEPLYIGSKRYSFSLKSFSPLQSELMQLIMQQARFQEQPTTEKGYRIAQIDLELYSAILARTYEEVVKPYLESGFNPQEEELPELIGLFESSLENPLRFSPQHAGLKFILEYLKPPVSKILMRPALILDQKQINVEEAKLLSCAEPGMLYQNTYYRFPKHITRMHLKNLKALQDLTLPEPLFGSFVENAMPQLAHFATLENPEAIDGFVTLPYVDPAKATCDIVYLDGELEATLFFHYNENKIPVAPTQLNFEHATSFVTPSGIMARNLVDERKLTDELFQDFIFNPDEGHFITKSEKKIVEFMTDVIPRYQQRVTFNCPQNLLDQFIYDQTEYNLHLAHTDRVDVYTIDLRVKGALKGIKMDLLWECLASRRAYLEMENPRNKAKKEGSKMPKILVLDLEKMGSLIQLFDELGIDALDDHVLERPLWSLANIDESQFKGLPVTFTISDQLVEIRKQMLGEKKLTFTPVPDEVQAKLRPYQTEGVNWLERLRMMFLNGILADDMGLGKTLQAIVAIAQYGQKKKGLTLIVCPTSLLYNWKEEFSKFDPQLKVLVIDGIPSGRKRLIENMHKYDVIITSYTLLQKDVEHYKQVSFGYIILDEAQHIKNRGTRNAKSVKMISAEHRLILSGTPIENSLDEMWSLFDFLMPGFLSSYDRFVEKYIRVSGAEQAKNLEYLRKKVAPFILRRMKADVLQDLPPISEIVYHCQLSDMQQQLYRSYAESARNELVKLVERDGFDRVQIHVLATLTRLKQICCHPAIFAKEKAELGDSAKYDMLMELLQTLIEGKHKTVIFSQYTRMLQIMREDFAHRGIRFAYLDGSSKNRLEIVKQFNEDETLPVFLVSLKAGGTGLNLVGADTVIHYDMWWNPAVENQATDRVHRMGQKKNVSAYKLITLNTIEEKIAEMQKRKKGLVKKVVSCDDEAIAKLTWEDVSRTLKNLNMNQKKSADLKEILLRLMNFVFGKIGKLSGFFSSDIGIDLGTANILIYVRGKGIVLAEPSVVAVDSTTNEVLAVGHKAKATLGRTNRDIRAVQPMKDGVIADFEIAEGMLKTLINRVTPSRSLFRPKILIAVPSGITGVEKRAVEDSVLRAGAQEVILMEEVMAAAIGVDLPVHEPFANMIVDIGGGTTEIGIISLGGIVESLSLRVAGDEFDECIMNYMRRTYNLMIGPRSAEEIKITIGSAYSLGEHELEMEVRGRDQVAGLPVMKRINSVEIRECLAEPIQQIIEGVKIILEKCPPELAADLVDRGMVIAGGGALIKGLDKALIKETGLPVTVAPHPLLAVCMGTGKALEYLDKFKKKKALL